jgi:hypothetical protein
MFLRSYTLATEKNMLVELLRRWKRYVGQLVMAPKKTKNNTSLQEPMRE